MQHTKPCYITSAYVKEKWTQGVRLFRHFFFQNILAIVLNKGCLANLFENEKIATVVACIVQHSRLINLTVLQLWYFHQT